MARTTKQRAFFLRHDQGNGNVTDIYFRIRPTAIRFSQQSKGTVRDTLGGYYREVIDADDKQYRGLMLPDLSVQGDTGVAYRREVKEVDWIWRNRGLKKPDGSPADLYLFDLSGANWGVPAQNTGYSTEFSFDVLNTNVNRIADAFGIPNLNDVYNEALAEIGGKPAEVLDNTITGIQEGQSLGSAVFNSASQYLVDSVTGTPIANSQVAQIGSDLLQGALGIGQAYTNGSHKNTPWVYQGVKRYAMRVYKIEITNFSWDDTIQELNRIKFSMNMKILRDLTWSTEDSSTVTPLADATSVQQDIPIPNTGDARLGATV